MMSLNQINTSLLQSFKGSGLIEEMCRYQLSSPGKRLRAIIPMMVFEAYGNDPNDALPISLCCEILHNATLVHDDIQDQDEFRRGLPTVWNKFSISHAIDCGNYLFQSAYTHLNDYKLLQTAIKYTQKVVEGQTLELEYKNSFTPDWNTYLRIVEGKTSSYLILPALLAGMSLNKSDDLLLIETSFNKIGIAFQIYDDLIDIYGNKNRNEFATDIAEGKVSALITKAFEVATETEKTQIMNILHTDRDHTTEDQKKYVVEIFDKYKIKNNLENYILKLLNEIKTESSKSQNVFTLVNNFISKYFQAFQ